MSDKKNERGPEDQARINICGKYEVEYWTNKFGVHVEQLRDAVKNVGVMVSDVKEALVSTKRTRRLGS